MSLHAKYGDFMDVRIVIMSQGQSVVVLCKETMLSNTLRLMLEESNADSGT